MYIIIITLRIKKVLKKQSGKSQRNFKSPFKKFHAKLKPFKPLIRKIWGKSFFSTLIFNHSLCSKHWKIKFHIICCQGRKKDTADVPL